MKSRSIAKLNLIPISDPIDPIEEIGSTGLEVSGGRVHEEFLRELQGSRGFRLFREMRENDPTIGAVLYAIEMLMRNVEWRIVPGGESAADEALAQFVRECMDDMAETWDIVLSEILSFVWAGFSCLEEVYKLRAGPDQPGSRASKFSDGRIGWRKLAPRAQETIEQWIFDEAGQEIIGLVQRARPKFSAVFIPISRLLFFRPTAYKGNPEGRSCLRNAFRPWWYKKRIENIEAIGVDRDLTGMPVAYVPPKLLDPNATAAQKSLLSEIQKIIRNIRRDEKEGVVFPLAYDEQGKETYRLELMSTGGRRQFDTTAIIDRYDKRIAMTVLADFILLGQQATGSYALSSSKTDLFAVAIGAFLESIVETFNRFAIPRLVRLNALPGEMPTLAHGDIETTDLGPLGTFLTQLSQAGIDLTDDATARYLRAQAGLPDVETESGGDADSERLGAMLQILDDVRAGTTSASAAIPALTSLGLSAERALSLIDSIPAMPPPGIAPEGGA